MSWGMRLNRHQVRLPNVAANNGVMDDTQHVVSISETDINRGHKYIGIPRVAGCFIHRVYVFLNNVPTEGCDVTLRADSNATTSVVVATINREVTTTEDKLLIRCVWKSGNNPLGVAAIAEDIPIGVEDSLVGG